MKYGMNNKRISFMDSDKRIADFKIRLKHDGLTKTQFFRAILTAYLEGDEDINHFIDRHKRINKSQSVTQAAVVRKATKEAKAIKGKLTPNTTTQIPQVADPKLDPSLPLQISFHTGTNIL